MVNPAIIAAFDPSRSDDPMILEAGLKDAVRRVKLAYHKHQYNKHAKRLVNAQAKNLTHAAKRMSAVDFHHYVNGRFDKVSDKGKKVVRGKRFQKVERDTLEHSKNAERHLKAAAEHHSYIQGHGGKKSEAFANAMLNKHHANVRVGAANKISHNLSNSGKTPQKNAKSAIKRLHRASTGFHDEAKGWEKYGNLKKADRRFLHFTKQDYKTPKAPKVDSKAKAPRSPGNPPPPKPKYGVEKEKPAEQKEG